MKICIIHGSPRKGNTYKALQIFKDELQRRGSFQFTEYFLPKDMPDFCCGCFTCFEKGEDKCPHAQYTQLIEKSIREADGLIFTTPVYSLAESGATKAFLDHYSYLFINHRPMEEMFSKIAMVISTTVGYGTGYAIKPIKRALRFWGIRRVLGCGLMLYTLKWDEMKQKKQRRFSNILQKQARRYFKMLSNREKLYPYLFTKVYFRLCNSLMASLQDGQRDKEYWRKKGWLDGKKPYYQ